MDVNGQRHFSDQRSYANLERGLGIAVEDVGQLIFYIPQVITGAGMDMRRLRQTGCDAKEGNGYE